MKHLSNILVLGDSILKGIQLDPESQKYCTKNEIDIAGISDRFDLTIRNDSRFGFTVTKGARLIGRMLDRGLQCDALVMDFGGNDCDFKWAEIAADPTGAHLPHTPLEEFESVYRELIHTLRGKGILPILTTLPPLVPQRFFDWWCGGLDRERVMAWLGGVHNIYAHQENYSRRVERIAREELVPLVDIRGAFLDYGHLEELICDDGTHPNSQGQALITKAFLDFADRYRKAEQNSLPTI